MGFFARVNVTRVIRAGLMVFIVCGLILPGSCFAENEATSPEDETFVLPESGVLWTRDGNPAGNALTWVEAHEFLNDLNLKKFAGCESWRLSSREELTVMLAYLNSGNADEVDILPEQDYYWSSSAEPLEAGYADAVNMEDGSIDICQKTESNFVWPVCDH